MSFSIPLSTLDEQKSYGDMFSHPFSVLFLQCMRLFLSIHPQSSIYINYTLVLFRKMLHTYHVKEKEYLFTLIHDKEISMKRDMKSCRRNQKCWDGGFLTPRSKYFECDDDKFTHHHCTTGCKCTTGVNVQEQDVLA